VIQSVLECAVLCCTSRLTAAQTKALESLQRTATRVIFQDSDYTMSLIKAGLATTRADRALLPAQYPAGITMP